jgi:hypothetical protein
MLILLREKKTLISTNVYYKFEERIWESESDVRLREKNEVLMPLLGFILRFIEEITNGLLNIMILN